jgi:hypothetical protein
LRLCEILEFGENHLLFFLGDGWPEGAGAVPQALGGEERAEGLFGNR